MSNTLFSSSPLIADVTFVKTPRGHDELKSRRYRLSPRTRQLLLLIDGSRSSVQLLRIFPERELAAYLAVLETGEFIRAASPVAPPPPGLAREDRLSALSAATLITEFGRLRALMLVRLLRLIGPAGEPFAIRIAACNNETELKALIPAVLSIVEVFGGPARAEQFARETLPS